MRKIIIYFFVVISIFISFSSGYGMAVTSGFGWRVHPITKKREFHTGVDIAMPCGTPVGALLDGKVVFAGLHGGYGFTVILQHGGNTCTLYGHCSRLVVFRGKLVKAGEVIAYSGNSGVSTGPHLHLEYWRDHKYEDPMRVLRQVM